MKHLIILGDGMADWAVPSLGNKTLLQYAHTPPWETRLYCNMPIRLIWICWRGWDARVC